MPLCLVQLLLLLLLVLLLLLLLLLRDLWEEAAALGLSSVVALTFGPFEARHNRKCVPFFTPASILIFLLTLTVELLVSRLACNKSRPH